jgi:serine/threonine protein phosphatase 1
MIGWLKNAPAPRRPSTPDGTRIYAIGDIHGCVDMTDSLLAAIADAMKQQPVWQTIGVFVGDYIDRGSQRSHRRWTSSPFTAITKR